MDTPVQVYLERYGSDRCWTREGPSVPGIDTVVVIPALAESDHLFTTLESIGRNGPADLRCTMVICVVNNAGPEYASAVDRSDNERTLARLRTMIDRQDPGGRGEGGVPILACIDASSPGKELPGRGGVGMARRIGMDRALEVFGNHGTEEPGILVSLDADTLVDPGWLSAVRRHFRSRRSTSAVIDYAHQPGSTPDEDDAVCRYETLMRYYVRGLAYARSPYAFHAIGSTIAVSVRGYCAVRGMSRREAGEDFHFLNKVAKIDTPGHINDTRVYPSGRLSRRVPFGTGQTVARGTAHGNVLETAWDPELFDILKDWIACLTESGSATADAMMQSADARHPLLPAFLRREGFERAWTMLRRNSRDGTVSPKQASVWFDALKTYKLFRFMTEQAFPPCDLYEALGGLLAMDSSRYPAATEISNDPDRRERTGILLALRDGTI